MSGLAPVIALVILLVLAGRFISSGVTCAGKGIVAHASRLMPDWINHHAEQETSQQRAVKHLSHFVGLPQNLWVKLSDLMNNMQAKNKKYFEHTQVSMKCNT
ncbi:MAG: hypothetical protein Q7J98_00690 [Kiritimatiellia bacterium]|nr:hypothetical protein [Kiritimatiellia bacterium]